MWQTRHVMAAAGGSGRSFRRCCRSQPKAISCKTARWPRSAPTASSSKSSNSRCAKDGPTTPCTPAKTYRAALRATWSWPRSACGKIARDAFCSEIYPSFDDLPAGAVIGTSSPRRRAQLGALRSDLRYEPIRGNVDTRLRKLREGQFDAIVLASAGLRRLGHRCQARRGFRPQPGRAGRGARCARRRNAARAIRSRRAFTRLSTIAAERTLRARRARLFAGAARRMSSAGRRLRDALRRRAAAARRIAAADGSTFSAATRATKCAMHAKPKRAGANSRLKCSPAGGAELLAAVDLPQPLAGTLFLLPHARGRREPHRSRLARCRS